MYEFISFYENDILAKLMGSKIEEIGLIILRRISHNEPLELMLHRRNMKREE